MPSSIECHCCKEMNGISKCMADNEAYYCITEHEQFKFMCLNKEVLYIPLVIMNTIRGNPLTLPVPNRYAPVKVAVNWKLWC